MSKRSQMVCQQIAVRKFKDAHYEQINVTVNKGEREIIKSAAAAVGLSTNAYICAAVSDKLGVRVGLNKPGATGEAVQGADTTPAAEVPTGEAVQE